MTIATIDSEELRRLQADSVELERLRSAPSGEVEAVEVVTLYSPYVASDRAGNTWGEMNDEPDGEWVHVAQYQRHMSAKAAEIARLKAGALEDLRLRTESMELVNDYIRANDELRAQLAAQQAAVPVGDDAELADRMRAAGMTSTAGLMFGAPLDTFVAHAGVVDLASFGQWLVMKRKEYIDMQARFTLDGREDDELYEWVIAHCAVFGEAHINFRNAMRTTPAAPQQGMVMPERRFDDKYPDQIGAVARGWNACLDEFTRLNADRSAQTDAVRDVLAERQRQISGEGWTPEHDDEHGGGQLARGAAAYAAQAGGMDGDVLFPWAEQFWKPGAPRRMLVKAGALILAEIERLDRSAQGGE